MHFHLSKGVGNTTSWQRLTKWIGRKVDKLDQKFDKLEKRVDRVLHLHRTCPPYEAGAPEHGDLADDARSRLESR